MALERPCVLSLLVAAGCMHQMHQTMSLSAVRAVNEGLASVVEYKCISHAFPEMSGAALFQRAIAPHGDLPSFLVHAAPCLIHAQTNILDWPLFFTCVGAQSVAPPPLPSFMTQTLFHLVLPSCAQVAIKCSV